MPTTDWGQSHRTISPKLKKAWILFQVFNKETLLRVNNSQTHLLSFSWTCKWTGTFSHNTAAIHGRVAKKNFLGHMRPCKIPVSLHTSLQSNQLSSEDSDQTGHQHRCSGIYGICQKGIFLQCGSCLIMFTDRLADIQMIYAALWEKVPFCIYSQQRSTCASVCSASICPVFCLQDASMRPELS